MASCSARPQEQFLQAFFFVAHPLGSSGCSNQMTMNKMLSITHVDSYLVNRQWDAPNLHHPTEYLRRLNHLRPVI